MRRRIRPLLAFVSASTLVTLGSVPAFAAAGTVGCGQVITVSTRVSNDLTDCPEDGLVIGADNLVLDGSSGNLLTRLTITGAVRRGIELTNGSNGNTVSGNHSFANGRSGIALLSSTDNLVTRNLLDHNTLNGVVGFSVDRNRVIDNTLSGNTGGIALGDSSSDNRVAGNRVTDDRETAILADGARNVVTYNVVERAVGAGVDLDGDHNTVTHNVLIGGGISFSGGTGTLIADNRIDLTPLQGIFINAFEPCGGPPVLDTVLRHNVITRAGGDGIAVGLLDDGCGGGRTDTTTLTRNVVVGSGGDGIHVGRPLTTVMRNVADHNTAYGIEAVPGVTDGGGNVAHDNGIPSQCLNLKCR